MLEFFLIIVNVLFDTLSKMPFLCNPQTAHLNAQVTSYQITIASEQYHNVPSLPREVIGLIPRFVKINWKIMEKQVNSYSPTHHKTDER